MVGRLFVGENEVLRGCKKNTGQNLILTGILKKKCFVLSSTR